MNIVSPKRVELSQPKKLNYTNAIGCTEHHGYFNKQSVLVVTVCVARTGCSLTFVCRQTFGGVLVGDIWGGGLGHMTANVHTQSVTLGCTAVDPGVMVPLGI